MMQRVSAAFPFLFHFGLVSSSAVNGQICLDTDLIGDGWDGFSSCWVGNNNSPTTTTGTCIGGARPSLTSQLRPLPLTRSCWKTSDLLKADKDRAYKRSPKFIRVSEKYRIRSTEIKAYNRLCGWLLLTTEGNTIRIE